MDVLVCAVADAEEPGLAVGAAAPAMRMRAPTAASVETEPDPVTIGVAKAWIVVAVVPA